MSGAVEALRHLELMALNTAQTASAASKVNECVALLTAALTTPPARSYADGIADAAKVPMDVCAIIGAAPGSSIDSALREAEAAIRLLSQEPST